ncbi:MAG TPA: rRNA adenine dimethyltransferase family protein, partial [Spirochaetia bacterium]|nr:rRNA adenine dimethyltransferase family protein [Spirochaetia bacterium]
FVKTWRDALRERGAPGRLLGNLPYRSASLMIADMIEGGLRPQRSIVTVQREAAQRMCSLPGLKSYSSFSVLCQAAFSVKVLGDLKPGSFYPAPDVTSSVVQLIPRHDAPTGRALEMLGTLARALFASRRKTIRNNIGAATLPAGTHPEEALAALEREGVDPASRAEVLAPEVFIRAAVELSRGRGSDLR